MLNPLRKLLETAVRQSYNCPPDLVTWRSYKVDISCINALIVHDHDQRYHADADADSNVYVDIDDGGKRITNL